MAKNPSVKSAQQRSHEALNPFNLGCIGVIVLALLVTGYEGYSASQNTTPTVAATPTPTPAPTAPTLQLHQNHQRQGPTVTVNPNQIGKPDPFQ